MKNESQNFVGNLKERDNFIDQEIGGRIILGWNLSKYSVTARS
jgi:hypothetical protein